MAQLKIPDVIFQEAASAVASTAYSGGDSLDSKRWDPYWVEKVLRTYVLLGSSRKIQDWNNNGTPEQKQLTAEAVAAAVPKEYAYYPSVQVVYYELIVLSLLADKGLVNGNVARPRKAQDAIDQISAEAPPIKNILEKFSDFLSGDTLKMVLLVGGVVAAASVVRSLRGK